MPAGFLPLCGQGYWGQRGSRGCRLDSAFFGSEANQKTSEVCLGNSTGGGLCFPPTSLRRLSLLRLAFRPRGPWSAFDCSSLDFTCGAGPASGPLSLLLWSAPSDLLSPSLSPGFQSSVPSSDLVCVCHPTRTSEHLTVCAASFTSLSSGPQGSALTCPTGGGLHDSGEK